jgi:hypothetical protein
MTVLLSVIVALIDLLEAVKNEIADLIGDQVEVQPEDPAVTP